MQNKSTDTAKVVGLVLAIAVVLILAVWNVLRFNQSSSPPPAAAPNNTGTGTNTASTPNGGTLQTASAQIPGANGLPPASPGQVRYLDPRLDEDPAAGSVNLPVPSSGNTNAFQPIVAPPKPTRLVTVQPHFPPSLPNSWPPQSGPTPANPTIGGTKVKPTPPAPVTHQQPVKVEGVVLGADGFAMLSEGDQTYFKRVGETVEGFRVVRLSENGVTVRKMDNSNAPAIWPIGQIVQVTLPGPAPQTTAPATTAPTSQPGSTGLPNIPPTLQPHS